MNRALTLPRLQLGAAAWALVALVLSAGVGVLAAEDPRALLAIALIGTAAVVIAAWPFASLMAIVVLRASYPNSVSADVLTFLGGGLALLLVARHTPARRVTLPFLAFLLVVAPSIPLAPTPDEGQMPGELLTPIGKLPYATHPSFELLEWLRLGAVLAAFCLAAWAVRSRQRLEWAMAALLVSAVVPLFVAFKQLATGDLTARTVEAGQPEFSAVRGPFTHPNHFAVYLLVVLSVAVVVLLEARKPMVRLAAAVLVGAGSTCLFLTYTRSAWIGFAIVLLVIALLRYRRLIPLGLVVLGLAAFTFPGAVDKAQERLRDLTAQSQSGPAANSWTWRTGQWERTIPYGADRPFTGEGFGSYQRVTIAEFGRSDRSYPTVVDPLHPDHERRGFSAHNDYVKSWVESGAPGLVLWVLVLTGVLAVVLRARGDPAVGPYAVGAAGLMVALICISASDNVQGYPSVLLYAATICGAVVGAAAGRRGESASPR